MDIQQLRNTLSNFRSEIQSSNIQGKINTSTNKLLKQLRIYTFELEQAHKSLLEITHQELNASTQNKRIIAAHTHLSNASKQASNTTAFTTYSQAIQRYFLNAATIFHSVSVDFLNRAQGSKQYESVRNLQRLFNNVARNHEELKKEYSYREECTSLVEVSAQEAISDIKQLIRSAEDSSKRLQYTLRLVDVRNLRHVLTNIDIPTLTLPFAAKKGNDVIVPLTTTGTIFDTSYLVWAHQQKNKVWVQIPKNAFTLTVPGVIAETNNTRYNTSRKIFVNNSFDYVDAIVKNEVDSGLINTYVQTLSKYGGEKWRTNYTKEKKNFEETDGPLLFWAKKLSQATKDHRVSILYADSDFDIIRKHHPRHFTNVDFVKPLDP